MPLHIKRHGGQNLLWKIYIIHQLNHLLLIDDCTVGKCPFCQGRVIIGKMTYLCEHYKNPCEFIVSGTILKKKKTSGQVKNLLEKNMTDTISGFESKKKQENSMQN